MKSITPKDLQTWQKMPQGIPVHLMVQSQEVEPQTAFQKDTKPHHKFTSWHLHLVPPQWIHTITHLPCRYPPPAPPQTASPPWRRHPAAI